MTQKKNTGVSSTKGRHALMLFVLLRSTRKTTKETYFAEGIRSKAGNTASNLLLLLLLLLHLLPLKRPLLFTA